MGVNTVGLVMTENKDFFKVKRLVIGSIHKLFEQNEEKCKSIRVLMSDYSDLAQFIFELNGDGRILTIHFDCDSDSDGESCGYLDGSKLILSLGHWGDSIHIIKSVLKELSSLGKTYILPSDYDGELEEVQ